jgi:hypothetical protein
MHMRNDFARLAVPVSQDGKSQWETITALLTASK